MNTKITNQINKYIPYISIIVPIYNSEKWLYECLQSLYVQTLEKIEIICINDGSNDGSRDIVIQFTQKDPRFILVDTLNKGPTNARKLGINLAKGEYIGFVDSDDYVTNDYFQKLYEKAHKIDADIAIATRQLRFSKQKREFFYCGNDIHRDISIYDRISYLSSGIIWNKIYKREFAVFISDEFYTNTCIVCEDEIFTFFALILAEKIVTVNTVCYFYRINDKSITKKKTTRKLIYDIYNTFELILNKFNSFICELDINKKYMPFKNNHILPYLNIYKKNIRLRQRNSCFSKIKDLSFFEIFLINVYLRDIPFTYYFMKLMFRNMLRFIKNKINSLLKKYNSYNMLKKEFKKIIVTYKAKKNDQFCDISKITFDNINVFDKLNYNASSSPEVIISLTSYPERINQVCYTLHSLLMQSLRPDRIELWLSEDEFKGTCILPNTLLKLQEYGIYICWTKKNIYSYKKIIPTLIRHPDAIIITADDDLYYPRDWFKNLYSAWKKSKDCRAIPCHRMHRILIDKNVPLPYDNWLHVVQDIKPDLHYFPTTGGGVLYPPHCFYKDITREDLFTQLAPTADDLWLWAMTCLNGWYSFSVPNCFYKIKYTDILMENNLNNKKTLTQTNLLQKKNDEQFTMLLRHYPELVEKLAVKCDPVIPIGKPPALPGD